MTIINNNHHHHHHHHHASHHPNPREEHYERFKLNGSLRTDPRLTGEMDEKIKQLCKEEDLKRKKLFNAKIKEYVEGFTVHGLTKIFHHNRIESVFWTVVVVFGLLLTTYVTHGLFAKYFSYQIYTEVRSQVTHENYFPAITICDEKLLRKSYFSFCGDSILQIVKGNSTAKNCSKPINAYKENINYTSGKLWSNGYFHIHECSTWDGQNCLSTKYFQSLTRFNNSCMQLNYNGNLSDVYSHIGVVLDFVPPAFYGNRSPEITVIPSDHRIHEIDLTSTVAIEPNKKYSIVLEKTRHQRLPRPYPSNCSDEKQGDFFPGKYGRRQCIESYMFKRMYKECGFITDYVYQYFDRNFIEKYKQENKTLKDGARCLAMFRDVKVADQEDCNFPCEELEFGMTTSFVSNFRHRRHYPVHTEDGKEQLYYRYTLDINYRVVDTYRVYEEKVLYEWDQLASEVGGFVGLVIGASIISLVEIIVCLFLKVTSKWRITQCINQTKDVLRDNLCSMCRTKKMRKESAVSEYIYRGDDDSLEALPTERLEISEVCSGL